MHDITFAPASRVCYWLSSGILQLHAAFQVLQKLDMATRGQGVPLDEQVLSEISKYLDIVDSGVGSGCGSREWALIRRMKMRICSLFPNDFSSVDSLVSLFPGQVGSSDYDLPFT